MVGFVLNISDHPEVSGKLMSIYNRYFPDIAVNKISLFRFQYEIIYLQLHSTEANSLYRKKSEQEKQAKMLIHLKSAHQIYLDLHPSARESLNNAGNKNLSAVFSSWKMNMDDLKKINPFVTHFDFFIDLFFASILGKSSNKDRYKNIDPLDTSELFPEYDKSTKQSKNRFLKAKVMELCIKVWEQNRGARAPISLNDTNSPFESFLRETLICAGVSKNTHLKDVAQAYAEYFVKPKTE